MTKKYMGTLCLVLVLSCVATSVAQANSVGDLKPREVGMNWQATGVDAIVSPFSFSIFIEAEAGQKDAVTFRENFKTRVRAGYAYAVKKGSKLPADVLEYVLDAIDHPSQHRDEFMMDQIVEGMFFEEMLFGKLTPKWRSAVLVKFKGPVPAMRILVDYEEDNGETTRYVVWLPLVCGNVCWTYGLIPPPGEFPPVVVGPPPPTVQPPSHRAERENGEWMIGAEHNMATVTDNDHVVSSIENTNTKLWVGHRDMWDLNSADSPTTVRFHNEIQLGGEYQHQQEYMTGEESHLGGRVFLRDIAQLQINDFFVNLTVGASQSGDGLALLYVNPGLTYTPRFCYFDASVFQGKLPGANGEPDATLKNFRWRAGIKPLDFFLEAREKLGWTIVVGVQRIENEEWEKGPIRSERTADPGQVFVTGYTEFGDKHQVINAETRETARVSYYTLFIEGAFGDNRTQTWIKEPGGERLISDSTDPNGSISVTVTKRSKTFKGLFGIGDD
jgi:hypothetical protein